MRHHQKIFTLAVCLVLCLCLSFSMHGTAGAAGRTTAKDVKPLDANGLLKNVSSYKGKVVVVNIFASWCPPCREEVPGLIEVRKAFPNDQVVIIGVSVDKTQKALYNFMEEMSFNYPVFLAEGKFEEAVGVTAIPQLLIYNKAGELVTNHKGLVERDELVTALKLLVAQ